jgi:O-glycosyl hydrolase
MTKAFAVLIATAMTMAAQTVVELPPADAAALKGGGTRFEFSAEARVRIWGGGGTVSIPRQFFPGDLPALFSRTLALDGTLPESSTLEWIFTGDEGGITLRITPDRLRVAQRYYDSYGLSTTRPLKARYPEKEWDETEVAYSGALRMVTVTLDHKLGLLVSLNGKQVVRQTCLLEVRRHQLWWAPAKGATAGGVSGRMVEPDAVETRVTVDVGKKHQSIYGFGGILSAPAYAQLSAEGKRRWWQLLAEYNLLIHREYPNGNRLRPDLSNFDRLEDATPHYYGDNFPNGEITDFAYISQIRKMGGHVLFEFWDLPPWARREYKAEDDKMYARVPIIAEYVRAMVGYCKVSQQKTGRPPDVVGIQNEIVQPTELWHQMIMALREGLDKAGFRQVKIHMPDNSNLKGGIATARAIQRSPEAWKTIDYAATHVYDFQSFFQDPDGYDATAREWKDLVGDKPFLSTELTVNNSAYQSRAYRVAFAQAQLYHKNMALMDAKALIYCWTLLDIEQPSFGPTRSLFVPDRANGYVPAPAGYTLRAFGAFSRRLREGMVRVDAASANPDLLATAYVGKTGEKTAILINRATSPQRVHLDWPGAAFTAMEVASPYQANAVIAPVPKSIAIQPGEVVTLSSVPLGRSR